MDRYELAKELTRTLNSLKVEGDDWTWEEIANEPGSIFVAILLCTPKKEWDRLCEEYSTGELSMFEYMERYGDLEMRMLLAELKEMAEQL